MHEFQISSPVVSVDWLAQHLGQPNLIVLDATIKKVSGNAGKATDSKLGIPMARFIDIKNEFSKLGVELPNMMLDSIAFAEACKKIGIGSESKIVVYDQLGVYSSPRVWWMFKTMGHEQIAVLDGGLPEWIRAGQPLGELDHDFSTSGTFDPVFIAEQVVNAPEVLQSIDEPTTVILDARSEGRFNGTDAEPRAGLRGGHIPGSCSLPYTKVLENGLFKSKEELNKIFTNFNIDEKKLLFTCGSGITASIIMLAAALAGYDNAAVYDGSWSEWGAGDEFPVEV